MSEEIKKEIQAEALSPDELDGVAGGRLVGAAVGKPAGGVTYKRAKNCPVCGAELAWVRNSTKTECMKCCTVVEAEVFSGNPLYEG